MCPVDDWYHLSCPAFEEFEERLIAKNIPREHIQPIYHQVFKDPHIPRLTPSKIIEAFQNVEGIDLTYIRQQVDGEEYKQYDLEKTYSAEDLRTCGLTFYITKR
jgi:hypothetical protein